MTSSRFYWGCSALALLAATVLGAEIKRSDLDALMPNRRVKGEGMGKYAIQQDIGPFWFWRTRVKSEQIRWGDVYAGIICRVEYREDGAREVNVSVGKHETGTWFFHDMEGEMMVKSDRAMYEVIQYDGQYIYRVTMLDDEAVGAIWHDGKEIMCGVMTDDSTNFPAEIVSAYLKMVPSGMKKKDLYNKDYDAWCRVEIPRRIEDLETIDWNAFIGEAQTPDCEKWQRATFTIGNLIRPVTDETTPEDEEFFTWYTEHLLNRAAMKRNGIAAIREDVKTLSKWWNKKKDVYRAKGRKHEVH